MLGKQNSSVIPVWSNNSTDDQRVVMLPLY